MNEYFVTQLSIKYFKDFAFMDVNCNKKNVSGSLFKAFVIS